MALWYSTVPIASAIPEEWEKNAQLPSRWQYVLRAQIAIKKKKKKAQCH